MLKNGLSEYKNRMVTKNQNRKNTCLNILQKCENCLKYTYGDAISNGKIV